MTDEAEKPGRYRIRRGKRVRIPDEWVGKTVHPQEIRSRDSKQVRKQVKRAQVKGKHRDRGSPPYIVGHPDNVSPRLQKK